MKILRILKHEFLLVLPPTIFFLIAFTLLALTHRLILREYGLPLIGFGGALVGALIVGKVVLVLDNLPFVNKYPDKPLLYNTLWKTLLYFLAALLVRYAEHILPLLHQYRDLAGAHRRLMEEMVWPHFMLVQMWLAVLLFTYCAMRELVRAVGRERVVQMFIGGRG